MTAVDAGKSELGAKEAGVGAATPPNGAMTPADEAARPLGGGGAPDDAPPPLDGVAVDTATPEEVRDGVRIEGGAERDNEMETS